MLAHQTMRLPCALQVHYTSAQLHTPDTETKLCGADLMAGDTGCFLALRVGDKCEEEGAVSRMFSPSAPSMGCAIGLGPDLGGAGSTPS